MAADASKKISMIGERKHQTAASIVDAFRKGETDPVLLLESSLRRAASLESVFVAFTEKRAWAEAEASAKRWRAGQPLSALDGVPIAWKDLFDIEGTITTAGSAIFQRKRPRASADAEVVSRAARAGMVCIGKTNLPELAYSGLGLNPHFGTPHNPFSGKAARIPGGSSSGSAVAIASGVVPISIGTDTAGSIRVPAAFNGLVGYRSSTDRYSKAGVFPLAPMIDSLGPLAHTVNDCVAIDAIMRGRDLVQPIEEVVLVIDDAILEDDRIEEDVRNNLEKTVAQLQDAGARVTRSRLKSLSAGFDVIARLGWVGAAEAFTLHVELLASEDAAGIDPSVRGRLETAREMPLTALVKLLWARKELMAQIGQELGDRILILPTVGQVAPELAPLERAAREQINHFLSVNFSVLRLTMVGSFLDMPGITIPTGFNSEGLPTSMLLAGLSGEDDPLLAVAQRVERLLGF
jgi:aspartyl-tRNA(Asn)/glutamyl-tRNA(Gln) amidotransferase subunit A